MTSLVSVRGLSSMVSPSQKFFPTWKTIELGVNFKTYQDFKTAFRQAGVVIENSLFWVEDQLKFTARSEASSVELVNVSIVNLGFKGGRATWDEVLAIAGSYNLAPCTHEVVMQLRLQHMNQPNGEWLHVPTDPIIDLKNPRTLFVICRGVDDCWIKTDCYRNLVDYDRIIFQRRNNFQ